MSVRSCYQISCWSLSCLVALLSYYMMLFRPFKLCNVMSFCHNMACYVTLWHVVILCHVMTSCGLLKHNMPCRVVLCDALLSHVYHVMLWHVVMLWYVVMYVMLWYVVMYVMLWYVVMLCHVMTCMCVLKHDMSFRVTLCDIMLSYVYHVMSCSVTIFPRHFKPNQNSSRAYRYHIVQQFLVRRLAPSETIKLHRTKTRYQWQSVNTHRTAQAAPTYMDSTTGHYRFPSVSDNDRVVLIKHRPGALHRTSVTAFGFRVTHHRVPRYFESSLSRGRPKEQIGISAQTVKPLVRILHLPRKANRSDRNESSSPDVQDWQQQQQQEH